jgi:hypothetical protein
MIGLGFWPTAVIPEKNPAANPVQLPPTRPYLKDSPNDLPALIPLMVVIENPPAKPPEPEGIAARQNVLLILLIIPKLATVFPTPNPIPEESIPKIDDPMICPASAWHQF